VADTLGAEVPAPREAAFSASNVKHLLDRHALPQGWLSPSVVEDTLDADGVELRRAGFSSRAPMGEEIVGSAAEFDGSPIERAYFELLERVSTVEWLARRPSSCDLLTFEEQLAGRRPWEEIAPESLDPARWRYARSNGVALHEDWQSASRRAFWELCERDRVLRAWYGETVPTKVPLAVEATPLARAKSYDWLAYTFPDSQRGGFSQGVNVLGVFGMPKTHSAPLVFGYGARPSLEDAFTAAVREATQLLAFLWGEPLPTAAPAPAPTPGFHLDAYQWIGHHGILRRWLEGEHAQYRRLLPERPELSARVLFVDLTPSWLNGLRVSRAVCPAALPLVFGDDPMTAHLPPQIRTHPIG
jgi:YcaO cyclodehydratase, ATP-ad Mg2+-binding